MWFLGAYEVAIGGMVSGLPRREMTNKKAADDRVTSALYAERSGAFPTLARRAVTAFGVVWLIGVVAYAWNARNLPSLRRRSRLGAWITKTILARDRTVRAGFDFTLAAMWRSNTHRLTLVSAAAAGFALAVLALSNADARQGAGPLRPITVDAAAAVRRTAGRLSAHHPRAGAACQLGLSTRMEGTRPCLRDRRQTRRDRGAGLPALAILLPLFAFVVGARAAMLHAALGLAGALVLLEALMVSFDKVPFTCTYLPSENMKALAPIYAIAFVLGASWFAQMQNGAMQSGNPTRVLAMLALMFVVLRMVSRNRPRVVLVEFMKRRPGFNVWDYTGD